MRALDASWRSDDGIFGPVRSLGWLLLTTAYLFFMYQNRGMQLDDALIYARYIENALAGNGLVYNEGIRFNGLTSPLFSYLVLAVAYVSGDALFAGYLVSGLSFLFSALVMARLMRDVAIDHRVRLPGLVAWAVAGLLLFMPFFFLTYGMETGLFMLLSAMLIRAMYKRQYSLAGVLAALVFLTRSEGALLIAVLGVHDIWSNRRLPRFTFGTYVAPLVLVAAVFAFNLSYYGAMLPETGMAKVWQGMSGLWGESPSILNVDHLVFMAFEDHRLALNALLIASLVGLIALRLSFFNRVVVPYLALLGLFYVYYRIPNYHWYYAPFFVFVCAFAGYGFGWAVSWAAGRQRPLLRTIGTVVLIAPLIALLVFMANVNRRESGGFAPYLKIGADLATRINDDESVALVEIGTIGFYSGKHIVDVLGLVNPHNAKFIGERLFDGWLDVYRPDHLLVHEPLWDHEISLFGAGIREGVVEDCSFRQPGYQLYRLDGSTGPGVHSCHVTNTYRPGVVGRDGDGKMVVDGIGIGHVDATRVVGNFLLLYGWAGDASGPFDELAFRGATATGVLWRRLDRPDLAKHFGNPLMAQGGFEVVVRFPDHAGAVAANRDGGCLAASRRQIESVPVALIWHEGCGLGSP